MLRILLVVGQNLPIKEDKFDYKKVITCLKFLSLSNDYFILFSIKKCFHYLSDNTCIFCIMVKHQGILYPETIRYAIENSSVKSS